LLSKWLSGLEKVLLASSAAEREAIFRFRYEIYVDELSKDLAVADHQRRCIEDGDDQQGDLFYTRAKGRVTGTVRLLIRQPGQIPTRTAERYSLDLFPGLDALPVAELSRLLIDRSFRGSLILPAFARALFEHLSQRGVHFVFAYCAPGLVRAYRQLGFRPYASALISGRDGMRVPLVNVLSDLAYMQRVGSAVLPLAKRYYHGNDAPPAPDLSAYRQVLEPGPLPFEVEPETVWQNLQRHLLEEETQEARGSFLDTLPQASVRKLAGKGFVMEVPAGRTVVRQDLVEREMFFILDGVFVVELGGKLIAQLHRGDVFGEIALLVEEGRRTATIRCLDPGRVLVLRRRFLDELMHDDPALAARILFNLSRTLAERLAGMLGGGR